jgi:hypothetical protein
LWVWPGRLVADAPKEVPLGYGGAFRIKTELQ